MDSLQFYLQPVLIYFWGKMYTSNLLLKAEQKHYIMIIKVQITNINKDETIFCFSKKNM